MKAQMRKCSQTFEQNNETRVFFIFIVMKVPSKIACIDRKEDNGGMLQYSYVGVKSIDYSVVSRMRKITYQLNG